MIADRIEQWMVNSWVRHLYFRMVELPLLKKIKVARNPSILEIGAGNGKIGHILKSIWNPSRYVQIDLHPQSSEVLAMDAADLKFADGEFDLVIELCCFHHIKNWRKAIAEAVRVGNLFVYEDMSCDNWMFNFFEHNGEMTEKDFPGLIVGHTHNSFVGFTTGLFLPKMTARRAT